MKLHRMALSIKGTVRRLVQSYKCYGLGGTPLLPPVNRVSEAASGEIRSTR